MCPPTERAYFSQEEANLACGRCLTSSGRLRFIPGDKIAGKIILYSWLNAACETPASEQAPAR